MLLEPSRVVTLLRFESSGALSKAAASRAHSKKFDKLRALRKLTRAMNAATPAQLGYRMPAEWEPHAATWFTWPRPEGISFPDKYQTVPPVYAALIRHLVEVEEVHINVWNAEKEALVRSILTELETPLARVHFH